MAESAKSKITFDGNYFVGSYTADKVRERLWFIKRGVH